MARASNVGWQSVLMDIDLTAQYSGEDIDRTSALVDLGRECSGVTIYIPTIDSAAVSLLVQMDSAIATVPYALHYRQTSDNATAQWVTTAGTGGVYIHCDCLGAIRYFRIYTGANQTADRTFYVLGTV
jgi:hypothetical protein